MVRSRLGAALAVAIMVMGVAGCGKAAEVAAEQAIEAGTGGDANINSDGSVTLTDDSGNTVTAGTKKISEKLTAAVSLPDGIDWQNTSESTSDGTLTVWGAGTTKMSADEAMAALKAAVTGAGYEVATEANYDGQLYLDASKGEDSHMMVTVGDDGNGTIQVTLTYTAPAA